jgi:hypothetical protein
MALQFFFNFLGNIAAAQFVIKNKFTSNDRTSCMLLDFIAFLTMISATQVSAQILPTYLYFVSFIISFMGTASGGYYESLVGAISNNSSSENRQSIVSKIHTGENIGSFAGYAAAAFILTATSYKFAFFLDALTYGFSMFFLSKLENSGVSLQLKKQTHSHSVFGTLFSKRIKLLSISHGIAGFGLSTFSASSIFILKDYFKSPDSTISIFYMSQFAANILGSYLAYFFVTNKYQLTEHEGWKIRLLYGIPLLSGWFLPNAVSYILFFAFFSAVHSFSIPMYLSFFQRGVDQHEWKIVGASRKTLVSIVGLFSSLTCGSLLKITSFRPIYLGVSGFIFVSAFFLFLHAKSIPELNIAKNNSDS